MRALRPVLMLLVAFVVIWYLVRHGDEFLLLKQFDLRYLAPLLCVPLLAIAINGAILRLLVAQFGVSLTPREWYGLTTLHAFGNYLPIPQAGSVARGVYLKRVHRLDYSLFTATVVVTYVQFLSCVGLVGLLGLAIWSAGGGPAPWPLWLLFAVMTLSVLILHPPRTISPLVQRLARFTDALASLRRRDVMLHVAFRQVALIAIHAVGLWLAFASLGRPVSLLAVLLLSLVSMASGIVNVTPGNLGLAESAAWFTAYLIRADPDEAVVAFTLTRLLAVLTLFVLAPVFTSRLSATATKHRSTSA